MERHISLDMEVRGGKYIIVVSSPGIETVRHEFDTEAEARAAFERGRNVINKIPRVSETTVTPAGAAFLSGKSIEDLASEGLEGVKVYREED